MTLPGHVFTHGDDGYNGAWPITSERVFYNAKTIYRMRGHFLLNGVELLVPPDYMAILNTRTVLSHCGGGNSSAGFVIGAYVDRIPGAWGFARIPRYLGDRNK